MDGRVTRTLVVPAALGAAAVGAATMFFVDPHSGRRRRALVRDQAVHAAHRLNRAIRAAARDARNRARGLAIESGERLHDRLVDVPPAVADDVLAARVQAVLGHAVRHPRSVKISVAGGWVTLAGAVEGDSAERLLRHVRAVPGVVAVENRLSIQGPEGADAARVPGALSA